MPKGPGLSSSSSTFHKAQRAERSTGVGVNLRRSYTSAVLRPPHQHPFRSGAGNHRTRELPDSESGSRRTHDLAVSRTTPSRNHTLISPDLGLGVAHPAWLTISRSGVESECREGEIVSNELLLGHRVLLLFFSPSTARDRRNARPRHAAFSMTALCWRGGKSAIHWGTVRSGWDTCSHQASMLEGKQPFTLPTPH